MPGNQAEKWILFPQDNPLGQGLSSRQGCQRNRDLKTTHPDNHLNRQSKLQAPRWAGHLAGMRTLMQLKHTHGLEHRVTPCHHPAAFLKPWQQKNEQPCGLSTTFWKLRRAVSGLCPEFGSTLCHEVCSKAFSGSSQLPEEPADATSPLFSLTHSPAASLVCRKDDVKNKEEHLEGRRAFSPTSRHPHPHLPFCSLCSDWEPRQLCWHACQKRVRRPAWTELFVFLGFSWSRASCQEAVVVFILIL